MTDDPKKHGHLIESYVPKVDTHSSRPKPGNVVFDGKPLTTGQGSGPPPPPPPAPKKK